MGEPDGHRGGRRPEQIPLPIGRGRAPTLEEYRTGRNPAPVGALRRLLGEVVAHRPLEPGGPGGDPRPGTGPPPEASSGPPSGVAPAGPEVRRDGRRGAERPRAPGTPLYLWGEEGVGKTHLLLAAVYFGVLTPIGLIMRLAGRDPMERRIDRAAPTYWVARRPVTDVRRYFRQF